MQLTEMYRTARSLEAIENYSRAGTGVRGEYELPDKAVFSNSNWPVFRDKDFWQPILDNEVPWGKVVDFHYVTLSEWVARVPGLFWTPNAKRMRSRSKGAVTYKSGKWNALEPRGKSQKVMGGIGTLRFPLDHTGYRLVSVSAGANASAGIPVLISPDVWEYYKLKEGTPLETITGTWHHMAGTGWSERFSTIRGIPKGFVIVDRLDYVTRTNKDETIPTLFHPYSVMEYSSGNSKLYDFVYATADTGVRKHRQYIEEFFEQYRRDNNRHGRYLLSSDISDPMWEADYDTPESLTRAEPGARSRLELLQARVNEETFRGKSLDAIADFIAGRYTLKRLISLSKDILIPAATWDAAGGISYAVSSFLAETRRCEKIDELVEAVALAYPRAFA